MLWLPALLWSSINPDPSAIPVTCFSPGQPRVSQQAAWGVHYLCCTSHSLPKLKAEQKICDNILFHTLTRKGMFPAGISEGLCFNRRWLKFLTQVYFSMDAWYWEMFPAPQLFGRRWKERCVAWQRGHPSFLLLSCARMQENMWSHLSSLHHLPSSLCH